MLKVLTACTEEIDEVDVAVNDILRQLDMEGELLANSAGIMTFYSEFTDTGVVSAICERLPFPVVGTTTMGTAVPGRNGAMMLSLMVLTSEDITFSVAMTTSLAETLHDPIESAYNEAKGALGEEPKLTLAFAPLLLQYAGDRYVEILDELSGGAPVFGTLALDHTPIYSETQTLFNGTLTKDAMALLLLGGAVDPSFFVVSIAEDKIWQRSAVITAAEGNILQEVNKMPLAQYLETVGMAEDGKIVPSVNIFPLVLDYNDGAQPVTRVIIQATEEGYGVCGGLIHEGASMSIASFGRTDVLSTTTSALEKIMEEKNKNAMIVFSCIGRSLALGADTAAEMALFDQKLKGALPYLFAYSGGEMCPVDGGNAKVNRFHNDTFVACLI